MRQAHALTLKFKPIGMALRAHFQEAQRKPLPQRWVDLITHLNELERGRSSRPVDTGKLHDYRPWSETDLFDVQNSFRLGNSLADTADFLGRSEREVRDKMRDKMRELGLEEKEQAH